MELARITAKGQATLPKRIREAAHIREGDMLTFELDSNNQIIIQRIDSPMDAELSAILAACQTPSPGHYVNELTLAVSSLPRKLS